MNVREVYVVDDQDEAHQYALQPSREQSRAGRDELINSIEYSLDPYKLDHTDTKYSSAGISEA